MCVCETMLEQMLVIQLGRGLGVTTGVDKPGQNPVFHAPPGDTEAATKRPISTMESLIGLCSCHEGRLIGW